jgi:hypothetical protein
MKQRDVLLLGLGAAGLAWMWSRTQSGTAAIQSAASGAAAAGSSAATAVGSALTNAGAWVMSQVRGIRNNNPGNIVKTSDVWEGQSPTQTDPSFVQFTTPEWGIRALVRVMRTHFNNGQNTIRQLITSWAPPTENNTDAYITEVAGLAGIGPDDVITDFETAIAAIIPGVITQENGLNPYTPDVIASGITLEQTA